MPTDNFLSSEPPSSGDPEAILTARLVMATAWNSVTTRGFHAMVSYGINYKDLPEHKDQAVFEEVKGWPVPKQVDKVVGWCARLEHAIHAAIQRKTLKQVPLDLAVRAEALEALPADPEPDLAALARKAEAGVRRAAFKVV